MKRKEFKDLTFADDFMFAKVMLNEKLCKQLLEIILICNDLLSRENLQGVTTNLFNCF